MMVVTYNVFQSVTVIARAAVYHVVKVYVTRSVLAATHS